MAYTALTLVDQGKLDLDTPLADYLERPLISHGERQAHLAKYGPYRDLAGDERWRKITARMALTHSTGPTVCWYEGGSCRASKRDGAVIVGAGALTGLAGAAPLRRTIEAQLYGVGVMDPVVLIVVAGVLAGAALLAIAIPARRAARIDPTVALTDA